MTYSLVPEHDRVQYEDNVAHLLQDKGGKLTNTVMVGEHKGKQASVVDQYGAVEMREKNGERYSTITFSDIPHKRRWVTPTEYDLAIPVDDFDKLRTISDPQNAYVEAGRKAIARKEDDLILDAFFATAKIGKDGTETEAFDSSTYRIAVNYGASGNTGLTVAKLKRAVKLFLAAEVDFDDEMNQRFAAITSTQNEDLLDEVQIINSDYRGEKPVLDGDGRIKAFMGFTFIHIERLSVDGSSYRRVPVWVKSGMHLGRFNPSGHGPMKVDISQRKDLRGHPYQIYFDMAGGATRLEQGKVIEILCAE
jgi:hypothetical protein